MSSHDDQHDATCNGVKYWKCVECGYRLCSCEAAYGHDCEDL